MEMETDYDYPIDVALWLSNVQQHLTFNNILDTVLCTNVMPQNS
jgi:hypothetical protein